jgi:hypothetical protein
MDASRDTRQSCQFDIVLGGGRLETADVTIIGVDVNTNVKYFASTRDLQTLPAKDESHTR